MSDTIDAPTSVAPTAPAKNKPEPFLQWVGGKRKIASQLIERIPQNLNNYYEPFLGGGALFFAVKGMFGKYFLSDINLELVTSYNAVKKDPAKVNDLFEVHRKNHCREYYYKVRSSSDSNDPNLISARFLYLNRYSFKGIYRINTNGNLDVSFADRKYKAINFSNNLQKCSSFLNTGAAGDLIL